MFNKNPVVLDSARIANSHCLPLFYHTCRSSNKDNVLTDKHCLPVNIQSIIKMYMNQRAKPLHENSCTEDTYVCVYMLLM